MRHTHATQHDCIHKQYSTTKHINHPVEPQHADSHTQPHCPRRVHSTHTRHYKLTRRRNLTQPHTFTDNTHTAEHDQRTAPLTQHYTQDKTTTQGLDRTRTPKHTKRRHLINTHTTHTHSTQVTQSESQQLRHPGDETSTAKLLQLPETQVSDQHTAHTHILARDCLTTTTTAYWEGDRNDQCEVCDKGGTLTECTRCNIVWHASCLHPIPSFPIRPQDAIVCGQACWLELTDNLRQEGKPPPTAEHTTTRQFLPRTHNTTNKTHSFPLVTYPTAETPVQHETSVGCAGCPDPQTTPVKHCLPSPTKKRTRTLDTPEKPTKKAKATPKTTKRKRAFSGQAPKQRTKKKQKLSPHINPWTTSSSFMRVQSALAAVTDARGTRRIGDAAAVSTQQTVDLPP